MTPHGDEFATFHNAAMAAQARDLYNAVRNGQQHAGLRKPWFEFRNAADESQPVEILIYDQIGKDWRGGGISAREFVEGLKQIPTNRKILLAVNSPGGNVHDGLAIYNQLKLRRENITARIDGIAASTASWLVLAAKEVQMPKNALFMIREPMGVAMGNAGEIRKAADALDEQQSVIASIYRDQTSQPRALIDEKMREETWFNGEEAKDFGFVDTLLDESPAIFNSVTRPEGAPAIAESPEQRESRLLEWVNRLASQGKIEASPQAKQAAFLDAWQDESTLEKLGEQ